MARTRSHWSICDICGFRYKRNRLKKNSYGLLVCPTDWEGSYDLKNHPQNRSADISDNEFIENPRAPSYAERNSDWDLLLDFWEDIDQNWNNV